MSVLVSSKAVGLVKLRDLFQEPTCYSVGDIAVRLGISQRTAQRWLYDLDEIGCAVEMVRVGGRERYRGMRR